MADIFKNAETRLDSPLKNAVSASYDASTNYVFEQLPRAINCSAEGTLRVTMGSATNIPIHVVPGLNPYRTSTIWSGSDSGVTVIGMW